MAGGDRPPYQPRGGGDRPPYQPRGGGDRPPYQPRGGGDRPAYTPRPRFDRPPDEGGMSIRLDPRRVNALKHLAGEAGVRPGDLVRQWVEERIDASRPGAEATPAAQGGESLLSRLEALTARVAALETIDGGTATPAEPAPSREPAANRGQRRMPKPRRKGKKASAAPSGERVALHDEMIAIIRERGPMRGRRPCRRDRRARPLPACRAAASRSTPRPSASGSATRPIGPASCAARGASAWPKRRRQASSRRRPAASVRSAVSPRGRTSPGCWPGTRSRSRGSPSRAAP